MDMLCILKVDDKDIKYSKGLQVRHMPVGSKTWLEEENHRSWFGKPKSLAGVGEY